MPTITTLDSAKAWSPDKVVEFPAVDNLGQSLILSAATVVGEIEGDEPQLRLPYVADDGTAAVVPEGELIPEGAGGLSEVLVSTVKFASLARFSREQVDQGNAAKLITDAMNRTVVRQADAAFIGGENKPQGILHAAGIHDGGALGENLDALVDAVSHIEADGGQATDVLASPDAWATVAKLKSQEGGHAPLLGSGAAATERIVLGVPVRVTSAVPAGTLLVSDRNNIVAAAGPVRLARTDDRYFELDAVGVRVTWRVGWSLVRPDRLVKVTTA